MRVLVTGAAGRLGRRVVEALVEAGHAVRGTDRRLDRAVRAPIEVLDLTDREGCYRVIGDAEAVVHLGNIPHQGVTDEQTCYRVNCTANINLFRAAAEIGVGHVVFASSVQAIGGRRTPSTPDQRSELRYLPLDDATPANPGNAYALSKVAGEQALAYACRVGLGAGTALRFPWLNRLDTVPTGHAFDQHSPLDEAFAWLPMSDAARLVRALLAARPSGFSLHLPASRSTWLGRPLAEIVAEWYPTVALRRPVAELDALVDCSSLERLCGWKPAQ